MNLKILKGTTMEPMGTLQQPSSAGAKASGRHIAPLPVPSH